MQMSSLSGWRLVFGCLALATTALQAMAPGEPPPGPAGPPGMGPPPMMPRISETRYRAAIQVRDGAVDMAGSSAAAVHGGKRGATFAHGISISSSQDDFNGVLVQGGKSAFTLSDAVIDLHGTGHNDFLGIGAGAMTAGGLMILRNVKITTNGAVASATIAAEQGIMRVYDSMLIAHGGALPAGYVAHIGPGMMEPPAPLKIKGTARANITMSNARSYFYHCTIVADGWGALSTDATGGDVYLEANDSTIKVNNSGYGVYADFGARVVVNGGSLETATYGGIIAGAAEARFSQVQGKSGGNAMMIHSVMGNPQEVGKFQLVGGNFATQAAVVLIKSANADVLIDSATLQPANGILVQSVVNEDANATRVNGVKTPGDHVSLRNGAYVGSILHADRERSMTLVLQDAHLTGAIVDAELSMNSGSRWTASADSRVTLRGFDSSSAIDAPVGITIRANASSDTHLPDRTVLKSGGVLVIEPQ
jgi:hypothetical protein